MHSFCFRFRITRFLVIPTFAQVSQSGRRCILRYIHVVYVTTYSCSTFWAHSYFILTNFTGWQYCVNLWILDQLSTSTIVNVFEEALLLLIWQPISYYESDKTNIYVNIRHVKVTTNNGRFIMILAPHVALHDEEDSQLV